MELCQTWLRNDIKTNVISTQNSENSIHTSKNPALFSSSAVLESIQTGFAEIVLLWRDQERFASKLVPRSLNVVTRSTEPVGVERRGKLAALAVIRAISRDVNQ